MSAHGPGTATVDNLTEPLRSDALGLVGASGGRVWIESGWRSNAEQQSLYQRYLEGKGALAAKPGSSMHEAGRAVDFGGDLTLAGQLAPRFQLERTVPGENWHYEVIGNRTGAPAIPTAGHLGVGGIPNPFDVLPNPLDAASSVGHALSLLSDPHLWLRVAMIAGGLALAFLGFAVLGLDLQHMTAAGTPATGEIRNAAGAGRPVG